MLFFIMIIKIKIKIKTSVNTHVNNHMVQKMVSLFSKLTSQKSPFQWVFFSRGTGAVVPFFAALSSSSFCTLHWQVQVSLFKTPPFSQVVVSSQTLHVLPFHPLGHKQEHKSPLNSPSFLHDNGLHSEQSLPLK